MALSTNDWSREIDRLERRLDQMVPRTEFDREINHLEESQKAFRDRFWAAAVLPPVSAFAYWAVQAVIHH